jgi:hypothetical protein
LVATDLLHVVFSQFTARALRSAQRWGEHAGLPSCHKVD